MQDMHKNSHAEALGTAMREKEQDHQGIPMSPNADVANGIAAEDLDDLPMSSSAAVSSIEDDGVDDASSAGEDMSDSADNEKDQGRDGGGSADEGSADDGAASSAPSKPSLGDRLRKLMEDRSISQVDLARKTGLDRADLNRLINNKRSPRTEEISLIAQALGVHQVELVTGVELPPEVQKGVEMILELETTALAEKQRAELLQAQLDALEKAIETERTASLKAKFELTQEHRREMSEIRAAHQTELVEVRRKQSAHVDDLNAKHALQTMQLQQEVQARDAEIGRLSATIAQLRGAYAILEAQNQTLRQRLTAAINDATAKALVAGLAGLAFGGLGGAAAAGGSRKKR